MIGTFKVGRSGEWLDAVRVTNANFNDVLVWADAHLTEQHGQPVLAIPSDPDNPPMTYWAAEVGDYVVKDQRGRWHTFTPDEWLDDAR